MIRYIFFDLDRTLWDFESNAKETLEEIFQFFSLRNLGVSSLDRFITTYRFQNEKLWSLYRDGDIEKEFLRDMRFKFTLEKFGVNNNSLSKEIGLYYINNCPLKTRLFSNCLETLEYLHSKYELNIITNGFEEVQHVKLKESKLDTFFKNVITSEKAGVKKPDQRIFQFALDKSHALKEESIMIGDDLFADILGAKNFGIQQVYFNPEKNGHDEIITYEITSLNQLVKIF